MTNTKILRPFISFRKSVFGALIAAMAMCLLLLCGAVASASAPALLSEHQEHNALAPAPAPAAAAPAILPTPHTPAPAPAAPAAPAFTALAAQEAGLAAFEQFLLHRAAATHPSDSHFIHHRLITPLQTAIISGLQAKAQAHPLIHSIDLDYTSELGSRKWQAGVSAIGGLHETHSDVVAWQLRGFAADNESTGGNVGLLYRSVTDKALFGTHLFLDYESTDYGSFLRYGYGLEGKLAFADVFANRYEPITDDKVLSDSRIAYSKAGWDVGVGFHLWEQSVVSGGFGYYSFDGEHEDEDDSGMRMHVQLAPPDVAGLNVRVEYDEDSGDFGGGLSYRHVFGVAADKLQPKLRAKQFNPKEHLYAPVQREYAQRIGITQGVVDGLLAQVAPNAAGIVINNEPITAITLYETDTLLNIQTASDGFELSRPAHWLLTIGSNAMLSYETNTLTISEGNVGYRSLGSNTIEEIVVAFDNGSFVTIGLLGTELTTKVNGNNLGIDAVDGVITLVGISNPADYIDSVSPAAEVRYDSPVAYTPVQLNTPAAYNITTGFIGVLDTLTPSSGSGNYNFTDNHNNIIISNNGEITFATPPTAATITPEVVVVDNNGSRATITLTINITDGVMIDNQAYYVETGSVGIIATLSPTQGSGSYTYTETHADINIDSNGEVRLLNSYNTDTTIEARVVVMDNTNNSRATITLTLIISDNVVLDNATYNFATGYSGIIGMLTPSGSGSYTFTDNHANINIATNGEVTWTNPANAASTIEVEVVVTDTSNNTTATATITLMITDAVSASDETFHALTGFSGSLGTITPSGSGNYTYAESHADISIASNGEVRLAIARNAAATFEAEVVITDNTNNSTATITLTIIVTTPVSISDATYNIATGVSNIGNISHTGGSGNVSYTTNNNNVNIANNGNITFTTAPNAPTNIEVEVIITDTNNSSTATATITINITNPVMLNDESYTFDYGSSGNIDTLAPTQGSGNYSYTFTSDNSNIAVSNAGVVSFIAAQNASGTFLVTVVVTDNTNNSTDTATLTIVIGNPPLSIVDTPIMITASVGVVATVQAIDGSGTYTSYTASSDLAITINSSTGEIGFETGYYLEGDILLTVVVTDSDNNTATATITLDVQNRISIVSGVTEYTVGVSDFLLVQTDLSTPGAFITGDGNDNSEANRLAALGFDVGANGNNFRLFSNGNVTFVAGQTHHLSILVTHAGFAPENLQLSITFE